MLIARMVPVLYVLLNVLESWAQIEQDLNRRAVLFGNRPIDTRAKLQLTVNVYNSAHVSPGDLVEAEERAAEIFRQAKIKINWELVPLAGNVREQKQSEEWNPADLHLRLWTHKMIGFNSFKDGTLGFCLSMEQSTAVIIADEINNRAAVDFTNPGNLLGLVMAHEMGHLLLPSPAHSVEGIMQARIPTGFRERRLTFMGFSRQEAAVIRAEIHRRTGVQIVRKE
jgi:hypothetical protein